MYALKNTIDAFSEVMVDYHSTVRRLTSDDIGQTPFGHKLTQKRLVAVITKSQRCGYATLVPKTKRRNPPDQPAPARSVGPGPSDNH
jgi:hypothetical protein